MGRRLCLLIAALLFAAACTSSDPADESADSTDQAQTEEAPDGTGDEVADGSFELVEPDPDPTPIENTDDVRIGTLDNGLTYYVRRNQAPGGALSLRLAVNAGSLQQVEPQSGSAHFLEHMLFNGTEKFPGNELARALERIGVQFGADLNAYTSFDETVYQLDLVDITEETVDTGFDVLLDWASAATIDQAATEAERGVVREELRIRDEGADGIVASAFNEIYFDSTSYEDREPGGLSEFVLETNADELRAYYETWYRPDNMAVIAVGDLPLDELEQKIIDRFASLEAPSDALDTVDVTVQPIADPVVDVVTHPETARSFVSLDYSFTDWSESTVGGERLTVAQELAASMIGNRLRDAVDRGDVSLEEPFVSVFETNRHQMFLGFNFDASDLTAGTEYVLAEMRRIELAGFTDAEYERVANELRTGLDQFLAAEASTQDSTYADRAVRHFLTGAPLSSAEATHRRLSDLLSEMDSSEVTDLFRWEMSMNAPLLVVVGPDPALLPTVAELEAAVDRAAGVDSAVERADEVTIDELMTRPDGVAPIETNTIGAATEWVFANGVTVRFQSSTIAANEVDLVAEAEGGWSILPPEDAVLAPYATSIVGDSGVGEHDRLTLRRFLSSSTAFAVPYIEETVEGFIGSSATEDVEVMLQQIHLAVTAPRVSDVALGEMLDRAEDRVRQIEGDASSAAINALGEVRFENDPRFVASPPPALQSLTADQTLAIYEERFSAVDDMVVAIVGDIDPDEIKALAEAYFGTLPGRNVDTWVDVRPAEIAGVVDRDVVAGSGTATGTVALLYPSAIDIDATTRMELRVLEQVLDGRLLDEVRERLGASYGGRANLQPTVAPREGVTALLFANVDPARADEIVDVIVAEASDVATNGPTAEEFERAQSVVVADLQLVDNGQLLRILLTPHDEEALTLALRSEILSAMTTDDIRALAAVVLPADTRAQITVTPAE